MTESFPTIQFQGKLRPSQQDVVDIAEKKLAEGKRHLHIVAPPGSGKTVLGLYLWAHCVKQPALVLSPNSAIQAQWAARADLFDFAGTREVSVTTEPKSPKLLTSLTYQSVTLPHRGSDDLDREATELWIEILVEKQQAKDPDEAIIWIEDLQKHNRDYYQERLGSYRKKVRDERALTGNALSTLHQSSRETLELLKEAGIGMIILDECHHLMGHWGRVLADAYDFFDRPIVVGLTATPPDRGGKPVEDVERYDKYFGPIDYEVPVPAVVKDGFLAPYQDLAFFVRPSSEELSFVANADDRYTRLLKSCVSRLKFLKGTRMNRRAFSAVEDSEESEAPKPAEPLPVWIETTLTELRIGQSVVKDWVSFERRDGEFANAARLFLMMRGIELPQGIPEPALEMEPEEIPEMEKLIPVLDRYVRHRLRRSSHSSDHQKAERTTRQLRMLGVQITETGSQACASPVGRVLAYSKSKTDALPAILKAERAALGDNIRTVVVCDYEKTSAVSAEVSHLLDSEAGGAVAAFKTLLQDPETDVLDPVLVTGSSVLVDDDLAERLEEAAQSWLKENGFDVSLTFGHEDGFKVLNGQGSDWCPRVYVGMITELFQRGLTKCLVGTRGLLGEGWDANRINVLIDLTTVTTSMSVNQLRGRSIRLDPLDPEKLANNWDVVCIAPEFAKGLDDYNRFCKKHQTIFGITDDAAIEKGVGHVHAAFTELKPEGVEGSVAVLNSDMLRRIGQRAEVRKSWRIGEPYHPEPLRAVELKPMAGGWRIPTVSGIARCLVGSIIEFGCGESGSGCAC